VLAHVVASIASFGDADRRVRRGADQLEAERVDSLKQPIEVGLIADLSKEIRVPPSDS
jgi:hypothetical protein